MRTKIIITAVAVLAAVAFFVSRHNAIGHHISDSYPSLSRPVVDSSLPDLPVGFGYKCMWIAVKNDDKEKIAAIVGLHSHAVCNWRYGIDHAYNGQVFITPPVHEWTFIVGNGLPHGDSKESIDTVKKMLNTLSNKFGEAQFFATHRVVSFVCWMRSINGKNKRVYAYADGENIVVEGEPGAEEKTMNLVNTFSPEAKNAKYFNRKNLTWPDEEDVMKIAAAWSIDPSDLELLKDLQPGLGILGDM